VTSNPVSTLCTLFAVLLALGCASDRELAEARPVETDPEPVAPAAVAASAGSAFHATVEPPPPPLASAPTPRCREQPAQEFLLRRGQLAKIGATAAEHRLIEAARRRSIEYRTRHYGRFPGVGSRSLNPHPPRYYAERTTFMGLPVVLHRKIVPALACVEAALTRDCALHPYRPRQASGLRLQNTFKDYEVSNHVYGIALDIDSHLNPCCGCVGAWSEHAACKRKVASVFERMAMPRCWVEVFERHGFYWLGHDELEDTMHFEFLGDPDRIFL
jgi:hypothetical protein